MTIAHVESFDKLNLLVRELGEHSDEESLGVVEESDAEEDEDTANLQENYNSLLEKSGEYIRVAKAAVRKMKKAEEDYKSLIGLTTCSILITLIFSLIFFSLFEIGEV